MVSIQPPASAPGSRRSRPYTRAVPLPLGQCGPPAQECIKDASILLHDTGASLGAQTLAERLGVIPAVSPDLHQVHGPPSPAQIPLRLHERFPVAEQRLVRLLHPAELGKGLCLRERGRNIDAPRAPSPPCRQRYGLFDGGYDE